jgi:hypothetical protein
MTAPAAPEAATALAGWWESLHNTASEHCAWVAGRVLANVLSMGPNSRELEATYALVRDISAEAADALLFPLVRDDAERAALCQAIATAALADAERECAARERGA